MKVTCMSKNREIFTCDLEDGSITAIHEILDEDHMPIILQGEVPSLELYNQWLKGRKIPENRLGLKKARKLYPKFEAYHNMFSLSDQYWFRYKRETWEKGNFFTNPFDEDLGRIFFEPWTVQKLSETPDLTTNGVLRKRWAIRDGKRMLIKAGSKSYHQNPISEVLASMTLEQLDMIPFVKYSLTVDGLSLCCICENFIDENTEYVPCIHVYGKRQRDRYDAIYHHVIRTAKAYGIEDAQDFVDRMICADHFICNTDRHLGNFGYIRDVESGKLIRFAPLFDCGSAFFSTSTTSDKFPDFEEECIKKFLPELKKKGAKADKLIRLIHQYPLITDEQEKYIIKNINRVYKELAQSQAERLKDLRDDDPIF